MGARRAHQQQRTDHTRSVLRLATLALAAVLSAPTTSPKHADDDFYARLGVPPSADAREIKKAYRALSLEWHPDKAAARGVDPELAQEQFVEVARAYETLSSPELRVAYDEERQRATQQRRPETQRDRAAFKAERRKEWQVKLAWAARMFNELFPDGHAAVDGDRQRQWVAASAADGFQLQGFVGANSGFSFTLDLGAAAGAIEARQRDGSAAGNTHQTAAPPPASPPRSPPPPPPPPPPTPKHDLDELLHKEKQHMRKSRLRSTLKSSGLEGGSTGQQVQRPARTDSDVHLEDVDDRLLSRGRGQGRQDVDEAERAADLGQRTLRQPMLDDKILDSNQYGVSNGEHQKQPQEEQPNASVPSALPGNDAGNDHGSEDKGDAPAAMETVERPQSAQSAPEDPKCAAGLRLSSFDGKCGDVDTGSDPFEIGAVRRQMESRNAERHTTAERAERLEAALASATMSNHEKAKGTAQQGFESDGGADTGADEQAVLLEAERAAEARRFFREVEVDELMPPQPSSAVYQKETRGRNLGRREHRSGLHSGIGSASSSAGAKRSEKEWRMETRATSSNSKGGRLEEELTVEMPMVDGCIGGPSDTWYAVDEGGSVHFRHAPRMEARVTSVRPADRGELVQAVAEACNLPSGWVQIRPLEGEPDLGK